MSGSAAVSQGMDVWLGNATGDVHTGDK